MAGWPFVLSAAGAVSECQAGSIVGVDGVYPGHARWPACEGWVAAEPGGVADEDCPGGVQSPEDGRWVLFAGRSRCDADPYAAGCGLGASWEGWLDSADAACGVFSASASSCAGFAPPRSGWYWVLVEAVDENGDPILVDEDGVPVEPGEDGAAVLFTDLVWVTELAIVGR